MMETGVETRKPFELRKPTKIERFGKEHFDYLLGNVLKGWYRTETPALLEGYEFRAQQNMPNGDHLSLSINSYRKDITFVHSPRGTNQSNMIALNRLRVFELTGGGQIRFENDDQNYVIGSGGDWHYVEDKKGPKEDKRVRFRVELHF